MILREKNTLLDILLFLFFVLTFLIEESKISFSFFSCCLVSVTLFRFKSTPLSPYFYLSPASIYLIINLIFIYLDGQSNYLMFFSCAFLGLLSLSLALRYSYCINEGAYKDILEDDSLFYILYFVSVFLLLITGLAMSMDFYGLFFKAIHLSSYSVLSAIALGSLISISSKRLYLSIFLSFFYLLFIIVLNANANDTSRLLILDYFLFVLLSVYFGSDFSRNKIFFGLYSLSIIFFVLFIAQLFYIFLSGDMIKYGGDVLIIDGAIKTINEVDGGKYEVMMPFFNGLFIMIPDSIWVGMKPTAYNTSAWFIEHVMGMDPVYYPWGIGISMFASGYLYGGLIGVVVLFLILGLFIGKLSTVVVNPFWAGFYCFFLMRLPFSTFRMDETFIYGSFIPMLLVMFLFMHFFRDRINNSFTCNKVLD